MNISKITKILEERKQAADEASKIQAVFAELDKVCADQGFDSYASFLKRVAALEEADAEGESADVASKAKKKGRKERVEVTEELVAKMKKAVDSRGDKSFASIAKSLNISPGTRHRYDNNGYKFAPKKKGRKPVKK